MPDISSHLGEASKLLPEFTKKTEVVVFSSTAIALYGYDQGIDYFTWSAESFTKSILQE